MKVNWKEAPRWARWFAKDFDGSGYWYEAHPVARGNVWVCQPDTRWRSARGYWKGPASVAPIPRS